MKAIAETLGFRFSRYGCPCNGKPAIYTISHDGAQHTLTIWQTRDAWMLSSKGVRLGGGNKENMEQRINNILNL
jgi:hypothetical protein